MLLKKGPWHAVITYQGANISHNVSDSFKKGSTWGVCSVTMTYHSDPTRVVDKEVTGLVKDGILWNSELAAAQQSKMDCSEGCPHNHGILVEGLCREYALRS